MGRDIMNRASRKGRAFNESARFKVWREGDGTCAYCGATAEVVDHIFSCRSGGTNDILNAVLACRGCNLAKGAVRPSGEWWPRGVGLFRMIRVSPAEAKAVVGPNTNYKD